MVRELIQALIDSTLGVDLQPLSQGFLRLSQWIPEPPPIRRNLDRSTMVPWSKRGNQAIGTVIVRPSARSAMSV